MAKPPQCIRLQVVLGRYFRQTMAAIFVGSSTLSNSFVPRDNRETKNSWSAQRCVLMTMVHWVTTFITFNRSGGGTPRHLGHDYRKVGISQSAHIFTEIRATGQFAGVRHFH